MPLVTLSKVEPIGIWVDGYPVIVPFLDSVLAPSPDVYDLVERWSTDYFFFKFTRDEHYMVYLPEDVIYNVEWAADRLGLV
jgi:hypothetical protein